MKLPFKLSEEQFNHAVELPGRGPSPAVDRPAHRRSRTEPRKKNLRMRRDAAWAGRRTPREGAMACAPDNCKVSLGCAGHGGVTMPVGHATGRDEAPLWRSRRSASGRPRPRRMSWPGSAPYRNRPGHAYPARRCDDPPGRQGHLSRRAGRPPPATVRPTPTPPRGRQERPRLAPGAPPRPRDPHDRQRRTGLWVLLACMFATSGDVVFSLIYRGVRPGRALSDGSWRRGVTTGG